MTTMVCRYSIVCLVLIFGLTACEEDLVLKHNEPWKNDRTALIIDAYHQNPIEWEKLSKEKRVAGVIHKATEGFTVDPEYAERKKEAKKRGYLWGSYHLGRSGKPEEQADFYLKTVQPDKDDLIALDLEDVNHTRYMSVAEAVQFVQRIHEKLGRYPLIYGNHRVIQAISGEGKESLFTHTPIWYARFEKGIPEFPQGISDSYTLWQFSSEIKVQIRIPGTRKDIDVNVFYGTHDDIRKHWPFT